MKEIQKGPQILIIDKNAGGSFLLMSILKDWGFEPFSVNSFLKAMDYCKGPYTPDLIIVEMQEQTSIFLEFPKKFLERTSKAIPMIVHSSLSEKENIMSAIQAGFKDYLVRPVEPEILHDKISNLLNPKFGLNERTFQFQLNEKASISLPVLLESINEFGIEAGVQIRLNPGTMAEISSNILKEHGLLPMNVKVVDLIEMANSPYAYRVKLSFVGLSTNELNKLRKMAMFKGAVA